MYRYIVKFWWSGIVNSVVNVMELYLVVVLEV